MANLSEEITGYVSGDDLRVDRTITGLESPIEKAWLTVKRHVRQPDDEAQVRQTVTTVESEDGQVVTAGGPEESGEIRFLLTAADTESLSGREWVFDIQILLEEGSLYTTDKGTIQLTPGVTKATE